MHRARLQSQQPIRRHALGFTLLELMVVVAIVALATAAVQLSMRGGTHSVLQKDAERLAALLESARTAARITSSPAVWKSTDSGFAFVNLHASPWDPGPASASTDPKGWPTRWLDSGTRVAQATTLQLGPEPILGPQWVLLTQGSGNGAERIWVGTEGLRPFRVQSTPP